MIIGVLDRPRQISLGRKQSNPFQYRWHTKPIFLGPIFSHKENTTGPYYIISVQI